MDSKDILMKLQTIIVDNRYNIHQQQDENVKQIGYIVTTGVIFTHPVTLTFREFQNIQRLINDKIIF